MKKFKVFINFIKAGCLLMLLLFSFYANTQTLQGKIRGVVTDKDNRQKLLGANIVLIGTDPLIGAVTNEFGKFQIDEIPIGSYAVKTSYVGYEDVVLHDIIVNSGKETVLEIGLTEKIYSGAEVIITAKVDKSKAINEMSSISARSFSIEETNKYAGSWGDPARMVSNFAGVSIVSDKRNDIVVRGNSPLGVLWMIDGIPIPNPNHFAIAGSSGGAISMINNNLLSNSDFLSAAFAPEYGNATAAVFDLKLRKGNDNKYEYVAQVGVNGFEVGAEGPLWKKNAASFIANYRYSTLSVLNYMGISIIDAIPKFQDISVKLDIPLKKSSFSIFGLGGISSANFRPTKDSLQWFDFNDQSGYISGSRMGVVGLNYNKLIGKKSYMRFYISLSASNPFYQSDSVGFDYKTYVRYFNESVTANKRFGFTANTKLNSKNIFRYGASINNIQTKNDVYYNQFLPHQIKHSINKSNEHTNIFQTFMQWKRNWTGNFSTVKGFHFLYLNLNKQFAIEPRIAINYNITEKQQMSAGFGLHHLVLPLQLYCSEVINSAGTIDYSNKQLKMFSSQHYVIAWNYAWNNFWRSKLELYIQQLNNIPAEEQTPQNSFINFGTDDNIFIRSQYNSKGKGYNYGIEMTIEKFYAKNYYLLYTASLFDSKYKAPNGKTYPTRYSCDFATNLLAGKDVIFGKKKNNSIGFSLIAMLIGGQHYTPIDLTSSQMLGYAVYVDSLAYSESFDAFKKINFRINYKLNAKNFTQEVAFEVNNVFNHRNYESIWYDNAAQIIRYSRQLERLPIVLYRIIF